MVGGMGMKAKSEAEQTNVEGLLRFGISLFTLLFLEIVLDGLRGDHALVEGV